MRGRAAGAIAPLLEVIDPAKAAAVYQVAAAAGAPEAQLRLAEMACLNGELGTARYWLDPLGRARLDAALQTRVVGVQRMLAAR